MEDIPESILGTDPSLILKLITILTSGKKVDDYDLFKEELIKRIGEKAMFDLHQFIIKENNLTVH